MVEPFFVTKERGILNKSAEIKEEFDIDICDPDVCLAKVQKRLKILEDNGYND